MMAAARPARARRRERALATLAAALAIALGAWACGDNLAAVDGGPPIDARHFFDADLVACAPAADAGCPVDSPRPVCDRERGHCVECTGSGDCRRLGAFGPRCRSSDSACVCRDDDDCAGNRNGPRCDGIMRACTCLDDFDCEAPAVCELEPYLGAQVRTCRSVNSARFSARGPHRVL